MISSLSRRSEPPAPAAASAPGRPWLGAVTPRAVLRAPPSGQLCHGRLEGMGDETGTPSNEASVGAVLRVAARSPLGLTAHQIALCGRAGRLAPSAWPPKDSSQMTTSVARARFVADDLCGLERLVALAAPALATAAEALELPVPLVLGLPEAHRPDRAEWNDGAMLDRLVAASGAPVDWPASTALSTGRASFAEALSHAGAMLAQGSPAVLVGAVDSYIHPQALAWLDRAGLLPDGDPREGLFPAEGAGFALLVPDGLAAAARRAIVGGSRSPIAARIRFAAVVRDQDGARPTAHEPPAALIDLLGRAAGQSSSAPEWLLTEGQGTTTRARQWAALEQRCPACQVARHDRLGRVMGDAGAATGALGLALACSLWSAGCAPAPTALMALRSLGADCGVAVLESARAGLGTATAWDTLPRRTREGTRAVRAEVQRLLMSLSSLPSPTDRATVATRLKGALASLSNTEASEVSEPRYVEQATRARGQLGLVTAELEGQTDHPTVARVVETARRLRARLTACAELGEQARRARHGGGHHAPERAPRGSVGTPALHFVPSEKAATLTAAEGDHLSWMARECLHDLAGLANLRVPLPDAPWSQAEPFERRLLSSVDALLCLGMPNDGRGNAGWPVLDEVLRFGNESPVPDLGRQFARAFVLCCAEGVAPVHMELSVLDGAPEAALPVIRDGLALAANDEIGPEIQRLCLERPTRLLPLLLEVLRHRREVPQPLLFALADHPSEAVTIAIARAVAYTTPPDAASTWLEQLLAATPSHAARLAAVRSLLMLGRATALGAVRAELAQPWALAEADRHGYLQILALGGSAEDAPLLRAALGDAPRDAALAGWYGHRDLVPWLIDELRAEDGKRGDGQRTPSPRERSIVGALHRITAAPVGDDSADPGTAAAAPRPALGARQWGEWWQRSSTVFDPELRYRHGKPYTPMATVHELWDERTTSRDRADLAVELTFAVGPTQFEPTDWIARQRSVLADLLEERSEGDARYPAGAFIGSQIAPRASAS